MVLTLARLSKPAMVVLLLLFLFSQVHGVTVMADVSSGWSPSCSAGRKNCHCQLYVQVTTPSAAIDNPSNGSLCPMSWTVTKPGTSFSFISSWNKNWNSANQSWGYAPEITTPTLLVVNGVSSCQNTTPSDKYHVVDQYLSLEDVSYIDYEADAIPVLLSIILPTIVMFWFLALIIFLLWVRHNNVRLRIGKCLCCVPSSIVKAICWLFGQPITTDNRYENGQPSTKSAQTAVPVVSNVEMSSSIRPISVPTVPVPVPVSFQQQAVPASMMSLNGHAMSPAAPVHHFAPPSTPPPQAASTVPQAVLINLNGVPTLAYIMSPVAGAAPAAINRM